MRQLREGDLLCPVAEQDHPQRIARELGADQMGERQRHLLRGGEAVLAVQDHGVRGVEQQHRGARGAVLRLVDAQVPIVQRDGTVVAETFPAERLLQRRGDVQVHGVAELVGTAGRLRLHPGGQVRGVVRAEARAPHRPQQPA